MSQFKPMETSSLMICQVIFENIFVEVYEVLVNVLLKLYSNVCGGNIRLSDDVWVMVLIHFEILSQPFPFYLQVSNMVNIFLHSHKFLSIFPLGYFIFIS